MSLNKISFVKIRPNSDKNINSVLNEYILKMHNMSDPSSWKDDIIDLIEDYITIHKEVDPILYINNYFAQINKTNSDKQTQNYDILSYDRVDLRYNVMLVNNLYNYTYSLFLLLDQY
jgi:hypothetical protein